MEQLNKPHFEFSIIDKTGTILGIIFTVFTGMCSTWYWALIVLLVIIIILLVYNIYKYQKQVDILYNTYLAIFNNRQELIKIINNKSYQLAENQKLLIAYKQNFNEISFYISQGIIPVNSYEKQYLENLFKILLEKQAYLYSLEIGGKK